MGVSIWLHLRIYRSTSDLRTFIPKGRNLPAPVAELQRMCRPSHIRLDKPKGGGQTWPNPDESGLLADQHHFVMDRKMATKFKKTLIASALLTALASAAFAETPTSIVWDSSTVPEFDGGSYNFTGKDVSGLSGNSWTPLAVTSGASGTINNVNLDIRALGSIDGQNQDKQIVGIDIKGGSPEFGGDTLSIAIETNFVGGGNNQASAINFFSSGTATISASDVILDVTSTATNGKSVYGIGLGAGGTLNITSNSLTINLNTATSRPTGNYSQAIGLDIFQNGLLQISENTAVKINVTSTSDVETINGNDGATSAYGILYEGGRGDIRGDVEINATANGGNAVGVGVTNYFYNTSMGDNWGSTAATLGNLTVNASSKTGTAAAVDASYNTEGSVQNDVILQVTGNANLTATTESGEAIGVNVSGPTKVEFDGNLTASASVSGEGGTAYSVKADKGTLTLNGAQNNLIGDVGISNSGTIALGDASKTTVDGNITADAGSTLSLGNGELELAEGNTAKIEGTLSSENGTVVVNEVSQGSDKVFTVSSLNGNLNVAASGSLNDKYSDISEAASALEDSISITTDPNSGADYELIGRSGAISDGWTANSNGEITSRTENESFNAFKNFNAMTLIAWRAENNHLTQRLGDIRSNPGTVGAWARVYGYDSEFSDGVSINYKSNAVQVGADFRFAEHYVAGAAFSYTDGTGDFSNGGADAESYSLAAYLSGYFPCGGYFDVIGRIGRLSTDISAANQTNVMTADYDNTAFGLSAEIGYRWDVTQMFYIEPQAELSYAIALGDDFTASNGVEISQDDYQSLVGRLGARIGANFADNKGSVYMTASVNHDFLGDADSEARLGDIARDLNVDVGGTWVSYGVGGQFNTTDKLSFYGTLEKSSGSEYSEDYRYSVGMRYVW